ncbi:MAG: PIN domain-containing protein [Pedobacter sp.]|nr:MAG: PIN domain-containing protein [Pedobacter sp.]
MRFVFDANILMAILISDRAYHRVILQTVDIISPDFVLTEIDKYSPLIISKTKLSWQEHMLFAQSVFAAITIIPRYLIEAESIAEATELIGETDPKDISYLALAIQTNTILVTRDKPIVEAARKLGFRRILLFDEFLQQFAF